MKNQKILLSALFMGLITVETASANCPQTVTYKEYKQLKNEKVVNDYMLTWQHGNNFVMRKGETANLRGDLPAQEKMYDCAYSIPQAAGYPYANFGTSKAGG